MDRNCKMMIVPLLCIGSETIGNAEDIRMTMSLIAGMPVMASVAMMVKPSESEYAMGGIFVTTIGSLITLPLICFILQNF